MREADIYLTRQFSEVSGPRHEAAAKVLSETDEEDVESEVEDDVKDVPPQP